MKKSFALLLLASMIAADSPENKEDATQEYRNKRAYEAIIHDAYYEAEKYDKELPASWKNALEKFGFKEDEINFYTAVRINKFTERVGNNIVILRPNFFLYLTDEEQAAYIGLKLASLKAGEEFEVGGSHGTFYAPKSPSWKAWSIGVLAVGLAALYHEQIGKNAKTVWPRVSNVLFSKGAALLAGVLAVNGIRNAVQEHDDIKKLTAAQFEVIDKLGPEGILTIREKQVYWGKNRNKSWYSRLANRLHYELGKLSLTYSPEADLERIQEYIAAKGK